MKKRYIVAAAAALVGGSLVVEMQAGSTGLGGGMIGGAGGGGAPVLVASSGGAGAAGGAGVAAAPRKNGLQVKSGIAMLDRDPIIISDDGPGMAGGGADNALIPSQFDGLLVQASGYDGVPLRLPAIDTSGIGIGGGSVGNPGLLGRNTPGSTAPLDAAISAVPEPATWISFIVGLGLVGYSLRQRSGPRSGPRSVSS